MSGTLQNNRPAIFGVPLDPLSLDDTVHFVESLVDSGTYSQHVCLNAGKVVMLQDDDRLADIVRSCSLVSADGQSVVWAGRLMGIDVPERVAGIDLMQRLLELSEQRGWPVYFLGARELVLRQFVEVVRRRYPALNLAGYRNGYFEDDQSIVASIADSGARLLFVGISSPRKEYFLYDNQYALGPLFAMGVGGSFDVWAGFTDRAPAWMQRLGLEWAYRLIQEPGRMWKRYLVGNSRFIMLAIHEWISGLRCHKA